MKKLLRFYLPLGSSAPTGVGFCIRLSHVHVLVRLYLEGCDVRGELLKAWRNNGGVAYSDPAFK